MIDFNFEVNTSVFEMLGESMKLEFGAVITNTVYRVRDDAKLLSPVDTGANQAAIYAVLFGVNGRSEALSEAETLYWSNKIAQDTSVGMPLSPDPGDVTDSLQGLVVAPMGYAIPLEYGTAHMAAQPFMSPAAERNRAYFESEMLNALNRAGRGVGWR
jgi:HK97 gp10 family phage protein